MELKAIRSAEGTKKILWFELSRTRESNGLNAGGDKDLGNLRTAVVRIPFWQ